MKETEKYRFCRLCEIFKDIPADIGPYADRLYALLDDTEKAGDELIGERLAICGTCGSNANGTCLACGCYCVVRSMKESLHCPKKLW